MHSADNRSTRKILFILLDLLVLFIILGLCFKTLARLNLYDSNLLDSRITAEIYKTDGRVLRYQINRFPNADNGDVVYFYIALPEEKPYMYNSLCTSTYNCDIEAVYDGQVIWEYRNTKEGKLQGYGNIFIDIPLPDEAFGKNLIIKCTPIKNAYINKLENVRLMPQAYSLRYPLINHEVDFLFCISTVVISLIAILLIMTLGKYSDIEREGIYLFLFFALIGIWELGANNTMYMITNNPEWCATVEYMAMFLIPVPYTLFLSIEYKSSYQKLFRLLAGFYALIWLVTTILNFTTDHRYYIFTDIERFLLLGGIILTSAMMIFNKRKRHDSERVILIGTICSVSFMSAELVRFILRSHINFRALLSTSFGVYGIMIFVFSLTYGYYLKLYAELVRRKNLERAALTDGMTGIANRNALSDYLQKLDDSLDYGILFFDVNNLKIANDKYGHETGDQLIITVAHLLKDIFPKEKAFCARYGGDEFLAIFACDAAKNCPEATSRFDSALKALNQKNPLPLQVQVAYGVYINDRSNPMDPEAGIKQADYNMYEMKKKMKQH